MNSHGDNHELKQLMLSMIYQMEALTNLLDSRGIISKHDLLAEMKKVHDELLKNK